MKVVTCQASGKLFVLPNLYNLSPSALCSLISAIRLNIPAAKSIQLQIHPRKTEPAYQPHKPLVTLLQDTLTQALHAWNLFPVGSLDVLFIQESI